jgi:hypothetical protein
VGWERQSGRGCCAFRDAGDRSHVLRNIFAVSKAACDWALRHSIRFWWLVLFLSGKKEGKNKRKNRTKDRRRTKQELKNKNWKLDSSQINTRVNSVFRDGEIRVKFSENNKTKTTATVQKSDAVVIARLPRDN